MAAASLLVAKFTNSSTSGPSLLVQALVVLKDMSQRGNVPASSAFEIIDGLLVNVQASLAEARSTSLRTADLLPCPTLCVVSSDGLLDREALMIFGAAVQVSQGQAEPQPLEEGHLPRTVASSSGGDGAHLGDLWHEDDFTFDEADLQWLDAVQ